MKKPTRVTSEDIRTLEMIYADGRLLGRLVNDLKAELAAARAEAVKLRAQVRTLEYRLQRAYR
jgi:cell division protein FtsB